MSWRDIERWIDRPFYPILAITIVALIARFVLLGDRIAHWDEGRVGYDILRYMATGAWEYRPIVHGPFLPHVNKQVFTVFGATDFTARFIVALIGGLFPLAAWLFRTRLTRIELIVLAVFFAFDPILVYYSRFMRNDVLLAVFVIVGVGLFVRLLDTRKHRYLYAGTAAFALAFTTKENAIVYAVTIAGGLLLLLDHRLFLAREGTPRWTTVLHRYAATIAHQLWRFRLPIVIAAVEFLAIIVLFYAPRAGVTGGIGLWKAFSQPSMFPAVLEAATVGAAEDAGSSWVGGTHQDHAYLPFLADYVKVLIYASGPLAVLAAFGFVADRYRGDRPRDIIALGFYWGFVSILGYPIAVDIRAAWSVTHAIVPLAFPAATGVALIYGWGREALDDADRIDTGLAALVLLLLSAQIAVTVVSTSYLNAQGEENIMVQYAQPEGDMRPALEAMDRAASDNTGLDVLWYSDFFYVQNESLAYRLPIRDGDWYNRLPLPWYHEAGGATVNSTPDRPSLIRIVDAERPPVIVTCLEGDGCPTEGEMAEIGDRLEGYREFRYEGRQFDMYFVFFIDETYA